jgi:CheY-like chemotaxis protein
MEHVLEHLGRDTDIYLGIFRELHRVCRDGAQIRIVVPHPRHDVFLNDPTHVRAVTRESLELFSLAKNREWAASGAANTQLARFLGIDFEIVSAMQRILRELDLQTAVVTAGSAAAAREVLQADASFDLLLLDLALPDIDGHAFLGELRRTHP